MIIDTHIHLFDERYKENLKEIIDEAFNEDVGKMIIVGYDKESSYKAVELANNYENFYASIGIHPSEVQKVSDDFTWIKELIKNPKVIAIGEIGLDYYWDKSFAEKQKEFFVKQLKIANEFHLPVIIHSRSACLDTYNILKKYQIPGVMHCYSYSYEMAKEFVKIGYYLGIGGVVTFKNSKELKEVVKNIDINYLLTETDGPYLAPTPHRGLINKPSYLKYIIEEISLIKNIDSKFVKTKIVENTKKLFKI